MNSKYSIQLQDLVKQLLEKNPKKRLSAEETVKII